MPAADGWGRWGVAGVGAVAWGGLVAAFVEVDRAGLVVHAGRADRDNVGGRDDQAAEAVLFDGRLLGQLDAVG